MYALIDVKPIIILPTNQPARHKFKIETGYCDNIQRENVRIYCIDLYLHTDYFKRLTIRRYFHNDGDCIQ